MTPFVLHNDITAEAFAHRFPLPYVVWALSPWQARDCGLDLAVQQWRYVQRFGYLSDTYGWIEIEAGRITDFASIPRGLQNLLQNDSPQILLASGPHDKLFETLGETRPGGPVLTFEQCNKLLVEAMYYLGATDLQRWAVFEAVQTGGKSLWNKRCEELGKPERRAA